LSLQANLFGTEIYSYTKQVRMFLFNQRRIVD
jgi:hypothetical protein